MPRVCTVCTHPERQAIDEALVTGSGTFRNIAARHGLSATALVRHKGEHLATHLSQAQEAKEIVAASDLLNQMLDLQRRTLEILKEPENQRVAVAAIAQARQNVELLAKLTGELAAQPTVNIAVVELPVLTSHGADERPRLMPAANDAG